MKKMHKIHYRLITVFTTLPVGWGFGGWLEKQKVISEAIEERNKNIEKEINKEKEERSREKRIMRARETSRELQRKHRERVQEKESSPDKIS